MGNDISKKDNIDEDFKQKSNLVIEELDSFFGPIQGFFWKTSDGRKTEIKGLDESYRPDFSQEVIDKIKKERNVCNNIIGTYKKSLKGLLKDKIFNQRINSFIKNKKLDAKNFDINIRVTNFKEEPAICDRILEYYWMKYLVYRMLRNLDPLAEEYALIEKFIKSPRWTNLLDQNYEEANKIKKELDQQRDRVRGLINENINQLLQDDLTYDDLMKLYKNLVEDKKLQSYAEEIYNICENLADLEASSNPKAYKFSKRGKLKGINLQNYKQVKMCERLKTRPATTRPATRPVPRPATIRPVPPFKPTGLTVPSRFRKPVPVAIDTTISSRLRNPKSILKKSGLPTGEKKPIRTYMKKKTEANIDNLLDNITRLSFDVFDLSYDINEEYDADQHEMTRKDISDRIDELMNNVKKLREKNVSDSNKQQDIDTYSETLKTIEAEYKRLKLDVQKTKPKSKQKRVTFSTR